MSIASVLHDILHSPEGGTADLGGLPLPTTGYFVGGAGTALVFPSADTVDEYLLREYLLRTTARYIGWWTDAETGKVYVDQSDWIAGYAEAENTARTRGEIAFWDIERAREFRPVVLEGAA